MVCGRGDRLNTMTLLPERPQQVGPFGVNGWPGNGVIQSSRPAGSLVFGVSPCSGCETGRPSPPFALRSATTRVPRFAPLRATATSRRAPKGAVGLRHGPPSNGLTAYRMRLHLASAAAGLRPSATPARRPRRRLPGTTGLRFAFHGRQRGRISNRCCGEPTQTKLDPHSPDP